MPSKFIGKLGSAFKKARFAYKKAIFDAGFKSPITLGDFNQERMPLLHRYLKVNPELIGKINKVQDIAGVRLDISSGYRTPKYTKFLQNLGYAAEPSSVHMFREGGSRGVDVALKTSRINQVKLARIGKSLGLDIEDLRLTPYHVHMELPTKGSPTKLWNPKHISTNINAKLLENKTNGLVNNVLHNKKVNHTIASVSKKVAHLFK
jgi:hypothetical protein